MIQSRPRQRSGSLGGSSGGRHVGIPLLWRDGSRLAPTIHLLSHESVPIKSGTMSDQRPAKDDQNPMFARKMGPVTHNQFAALLVDGLLLREL